MTSAEYYALTVRPIYRSYPAYAAGREPAGYLDTLRQRDPEIIFDPSKLHTREDWIRAGKLVFESDTSFRPAPAAQPASDKTTWPIAPDGTLPWYVPGFRYYIRKKGDVEDSTPPPDPSKATKKASTSPPTTNAPSSPS
jgi:hypothetical protein